MNLFQICRYITDLEPRQLPEEHELGLRIMCPEYSISVQDIKTYPLPGQDRLFALCWNMDERQRLFATMKPSEAPFCYSCTFESGDKTQLHTHDYIELAYVVYGTFRQKILGKDITFHKGELCLIDKNCLHQDYLFSSQSVVLFIGLANEMFDEIMDENVTTQKIISFLQSALMKQKDVQQYLHFKPHPTAVVDMETCLGSLIQELCCNDKGSRYICKGLMMRIFRILSTNYEFSLSKELRKTMNWVVFEEVTGFIKQHYAQMSILDLVEHFHFQEDYFNRLIKSKTGLTYSQYIQQIRLSEAEQLLKNTRYSIEQIADLVGYHNKGYFYKIFQKRNGMTPLAYRKASSAGHAPSPGRIPPD